MTIRSLRMADQLQLPSIAIIYTSQSSIGFGLCRSRSPLHQNRIVLWGHRWPFLSQPAQQASRMLPTSNCPETRFVYTPSRHGLEFPARLFGKQRNSFEHLPRLPLQTSSSRNRLIVRTHIIERPSWLWFNVSE